MIGVMLSYLKYEVLHGLWAILWCSPLLLVLSLMWITRWRSFWGALMRDSFTRISLLVGLFLLVLGLSWLSHVFADIYGLGF
jgi:hypothetical protein